MEFSNTLNNIRITLKSAFKFFKTFGLRSTIFKIIDYIEYYKHYNKWYSAHTLTNEERKFQISYSFDKNPLISIVVPAYKTPAKFLREMIESVTSQTYPNWELCIADGSADKSSSYIAEIVHEYQVLYPNIHYKILDANLGISGNTNAALDMVSGEYIGLLDHDDILTPNALFEVVAAINNNPDTNIIYTDEDKTDLNLSSFYSPYFKPDFNLDLLRSCNYITHFFVVKKDLAFKAGGFSIDCNGSQDYDFILKTCDLTQNIVHIPKILYHWRIHPASVAGDPESKTYAYTSAIHALDTHLTRSSDSGTVNRGDTFGYYKVHYSYKNNPLISIYLKDCSDCLSEEIQAALNYSNIQFITSLSQAQGEYTVILYRIKKILSNDWIKPLLENCSRSNIGIASGKACLSPKTLLEFGLIHDTNGQLISPFYKHPLQDTGYCFQAHVQHNCNFVSPFCVMTKTPLLNDFFPHNKEHSFLEQYYKFCYMLTQNNYLITLLPDVIVLCSPFNYELPQLPYCVNKQDSAYNPNFSTTHPFKLS